MRPSLRPLFAQTKKPRIPNVFYKNRDREIAPEEVKSGQSDDTNTLKTGTGNGALLAYSDGIPPG